MRLIFFFLFILIQGCALQSFLVPQIDLVIELRMQAQLDLYYKQKQMLSKDIDLYLNSQKYRVPDALKLMNSIDLESALKTEDNFNQILALYKSASMDFNLLLCRYLSLLDTRQQEHFFKKQFEDNTKIAEYMLEQNLVKLKERVEFFTGPVQKNQEPILSAYLPSWKKRTEIRLERRKGLHTKLKLILAGPLTSEEKTTKLAGEFEQYISESFSDREDIVKFIKDLSLTLSLEQKKHLRDKKSMLRELLKKFSEVEF